MTPEKTLGVMELEGGGAGMTPASKGREEVGQESLQQAEDRNEWGRNDFSK